MPSTTTSTPLPTPELLEASSQALNESYNRMEEIEILLRAADAAAANGVADYTVSDETIGRLYRHLNTIDIELEQAIETASAIRVLVGHLDAHGRDFEIQARRQEASGVA